MNWLKGLGISVKVAVTALLMAMAVMAAKRHKAEANKWKITAIDIKQGNVDKGTMTAKAANSQAKIHSAKAKDIKKKAEARAKQMGGQDEEISSILDQFKSS